jgi:hypothetical protein
LRIVIGSLKALDDLDGYLCIVIGDLRLIVTAPALQLAPTTGLTRHLKSSSFTDERNLWRQRPQILEQT